MYTLRFGDAFLNSVKKLDRAVQLQIKNKLVRLEKGMAKIEQLRGKLSGAELAKVNSLI